MNNIIFTPEEFRKIVYSSGEILDHNPMIDILNFLGKPLIRLSDGYVLWFTGQCDYCGEREFDDKKCLHCGAPLDRQGKCFSSSTNETLEKLML